ncbi:hypothetical protein GQ44DRAFT_309964 [Phaeosphaeriaceae sp. PMI808]|nr:hypothetical protein GQ44DRAFT_309964 [Phaeosphaeriaceae sp. PMI808]
MNGQAIPGFYWDPEKKKYFKIQSATASRDLNLKYSAQNIRKAEREERVQSTVTARTNKTRKERVTRQHANNLTHSCLEREIGFKRRSVYVQASWPEACIHGVSASPKKFVQRPSGAPIRCFEHDPVSKTIYVVQGDNSIKRRRIRTTKAPTLSGQHSQADQNFDYLSNNESSFEPWDELQRTTSTISSMSYLPATGALATTTYGSDRPPVVYLSDPEIDGPYVGQQFTPKGCTSIWSAAARPMSFEHSPATNSVPASNAEHLAVAASSSLLLFTRSQTGAWDMNQPLPSLETDILALTWLSPTTLALGCRNGKIRLFDTRSAGSSHIFTHPHPISRLKRADDQTRVLASGLQDTLFLYDIRAPRISHASRSSFNYANHHYNDDYFSAAYPHGRNAKKRRKLSHTAFKHWSQPVIAFPHANIDDLELDLDVHARLGLVAAAQSEESGTAIRVCSLWTGQIVKEVGVAGGGLKSRDRIRCLRFGW